jgi:hypothetical protein
MPDEPTPKPTTARRRARPAAAKAAATPTVPVRRRPAKPASTADGNGRSGPAAAHRAVEIIAPDQGAIAPRGGAGADGDLEVSRGAVGRLEARDVTVNQGAIGGTRAERVNVQMGALGFALTGDLEVHQSAVRSVIAREAHLEQSVTRTVIAQDVHMDRGSFALVVIARRVDGQVRAILDWRGAIAFGAAAGLVISVLRRGRRRHG